VGDLATSLVILPKPMRITNVYAERTKITITPKLPKPKPNSSTHTPNVYVYYSSTDTYAAESDKKQAGGQGAIPSAPTYALMSCPLQLISLTYMSSVVQYFFLIINQLQYQPANREG
jgi:hypothetical protein